MSYNASSTYMSFLMRSTDGENYTKVIDIKEMPATGQAPDLLDTTTMTDKQTTGINGIITLDNLEFTANYDPDQYKILKGYQESDREKPAYYALWFGGTEVAGSDPTPTGNLGKFSFQGRLAAWTEGGSVNEVRNIGFSIAPATPIEFTLPTGDGA